MEQPITSQLAFPKSGHIIEYDYPTAERLDLNMGPQHPSTHGVLRLLCELDGETILGIRPVIGYLHSGKEKIAEAKTYHKFIPYTDRLDYLSPMANNVAYVSAIEKLLDLEITERCKFLRTILCEMARLSSHLLWLGTHVMEVGAMTPFLYTFQNREELYDLFEWISGARFTVSYMRIGGVARPIPDGWLDAVRKFVNYMLGRIQEYHDLITLNDIYIGRVRNVGCISKQDAIDLGLTGPSLRACGVDWDIRKANPYLVYDRLDFKVPTNPDGDCYARYLVRMDEMVESCKIILQCIEMMPQSGPLTIEDPKLAIQPKEHVKETMEDLIHHFLLVSDGVYVPAGEAYFAIEASKGELGFYVVSTGGYKPYRLKIRSPSFVNLQSMNKMSAGSLLGDVVAVIGSLDFVLGEIDR